MQSELLRPKTDVDCRQRPDEATDPAMEDACFVEAVVREPGRSEDGVGPELEGEGDAERYEGVGDETESRRGGPEILRYRRVRTGEQRVLRIVSFITQWERW